MSVPAPQRWRQLLFRKSVRCQPRVFRREFEPPLRLATFMIKPLGYGRLLQGRARSLSLLALIAGLTLSQMSHARAIRVLSATQEANPSQDPHNFVPSSSTDTKLIQGTSQLAPPSEQVSADGSGSNITLTPEGPATNSSLASMGASVLSPDNSSQNSATSSYVAAQNGQPLNDQQAADGKQQQAMNMQQQQQPLYYQQQQVPGYPQKEQQQQQQQPIYSQQQQQPEYYQQQQQPMYSQQAQQQLYYQQQQQQQQQPILYQQQQQPSYRQQSGSQPGQQPLYTQQPQKQQQLATQPQQQQQQQAVPGVEASSGPILASKLNALQSYLNPQPAPAPAIILQPVPVPVPAPQLAAAAAPAPVTPTVVGSGGIKITTSNPVSISNPINIQNPNINGVKNTGLGGLLAVIPLPLPLPLPIIGRRT